MPAKAADLLVVGGGIVGLATAYRFSQAHTGKRVAVLEKEPRLAAHQTGRNSGVVHSGVYYKPGSLKARYCVEGRLQLEAFCQEHDVAYEQCGKVIVAIDDAEASRLDEIERRGNENGVPCERIGVERLRELEPHAAGVAALHVTVTGIVDYVGMTQKLADLLIESGGEVILDARVSGLQTRADGVTAETTAGNYTAPLVVNCGGLHSDRLAAMSGANPEARIVPFRGEYYELTADAQHLVKNLIYPVPDPQFPFLGVHFTRMVEGGVECGPNAVLAFAREGYRKTSFNAGDLAQALLFPGMRRIALKHWRMGLGEMWRSVSKPAFVKALQRLVPEIQSEHLQPIDAGVRAQAVLPNGELVDDFVIDSTPRVVNVINAPSPAATAALQIGQHIADQVAQRLD
ncbi:MAG: L-2-hydroxyglutarate oxidase [Planctomycetota bacterium]